MARKDGTTSGSLTGEPDLGTGLVPEKDEEPCDLDSGDEEKDALIPDRHNPPLGAAQSTSGGESVGSPYSWAPSWRLYWGAKAAGRRASTWLTQPIDQDIYSDWDPEAQTKARMTTGLGKKSPFKKGAGLQVVSREASSASEEAGGPKSSEESVGNDSDLA
uniref:Uncharacterized protein n=1 Tax=Sphaerodactylus townsendi TaxID=933632 RepID=A0ACB8FTF7_9SAUR